MKYDAIVDQGISIHERVPIPERLIPEDSRVEIDAKIYAGYFTNEKIPSREELSQVHGRAWYVYYQTIFSSLVPGSEVHDCLRTKVTLSNTLSTTTCHSA